MALYSVLCWNQTCSQTPFYTGIKWYQNDVLSLRLLLSEKFLIFSVCMHGSFHFQCRYLILEWQGNWKMKHITLSSVREQSLWNGQHRRPFITRSTALPVTFGALECLCLRYGLWDCVRLENCHIKWSVNLSSEICPHVHIRIYICITVPAELDCTYIRMCELSSNVCTYVLVWLLIYTPIVHIFLYVHAYVHGMCNDVTIEPL